MPAEGQTELKKPSELRKGAIVILSGKLCRVVETTTFATGKHGHTKVKIVAKDLVAEKRVEELVHSRDSVSVPAKSWVDKNRKRLKA